jgi:hypothetical protein
MLLDGIEDGANRYRFHAWQSALLFSAIFVLHVLLSWSSFLSWVIFLGDLGLIGYLTMRAYKDGLLFPPGSDFNDRADSEIADTLDRCEVPFFGRLASKFLDDE